jgi:flagellar protein FliS
MEKDNPTDRKNPMRNTAAMNQYKQVGIHASVENADPHTLVQMLFDGAIERLNMAKMHMHQGNIALKGENISRAISIVDGLRTSLDMEKGGEIAENLEALYDYMQRQLLKANIENSEEKIQEVLSLIGEIRAGWMAIPVEIRKTKTVER